MLKSRITDMTMGHWIGPFYFPPTFLITGSLNEMTGFLPSAKMLDIAFPHMGFFLGIVPIPPLMHTPIALIGAKTKFINGLPSFRMLDFYHCGDIQLTGWPTCIVLK